MKYRIKKEWKHWEFGWGRCPMEGWTYTIEEAHKSFWSDKINWKEWNGWIKPTNQDEKWAKKALKELEGNARENKTTGYIYSAT